MARKGATTRTVLRLEPLEQRDVPSTFNTIRTNPITPEEIYSNEFQQVYSGDFDADGASDDLFFWSPRTGANQLVTNVNTATPTVTNNPISPETIRGRFFVAASGDFNGGGANNDLFFWNRITGHNVLVLALAGPVGPVVITDPVVPEAIRGNATSQLVAGNFNPGSLGTELFFWRLRRGGNALVADVDGAGTVTANPLLPRLINRRFKVAVAGNFDTTTASDELFFWHPKTGRNLLVADLAGATSLTSATVDPRAIRRVYTTVVAGDLDGTTGTELFFWNPRSGRNRLVVDVDGAATVTTNPVDPTAINNLVFSRLTTGSVVDGDTGLFFWNPRFGRNWAIDE